MTFSVFGVEPLTVFRLMGADENSGTFALGWTLQHSKSLLEHLVQQVFGTSLGPEPIAIALQTHSADGGYTDIELVQGRRFHAVFEAKRWWQLPSRTQFERYLPRLTAARARLKRFVSISGASKSFAGRRSSIKSPRDLIGTKRHSGHR